MSVVCEVFAVILFAFFSLFFAGCIVRMVFDTIDDRRRAKRDEAREARDIEYHEARMTEYKK